MPGKSKVTVAQYVEQQLAMSDKTQREVALELGYRQPNIITMFKTGEAKVPVNKVVPLAKALGLDPRHLLRMVVQEYQPELWEALKVLVGTEVVTESEQQLLAIVRDVTQGVDLDYLRDDVHDDVAAVLAKHAVAERGRREAAANSSRTVRPGSKMDQKLKGGTS